MTDRQRFDKLIGAVLEHEGGYVNDPDDPGGETKHGISKRTYPDLDIAGLTESQARDIYYRDWWLRLRCNEIRNDWVAQKYLDTCVNTGIRSGTRILQQALGATGYPIAVDGIIGPKTLAATNAASMPVLLYAMRRLQAEHYESLIRRNPKLAKFRRGWIARAAF